MKKELLEQIENEMQIQLSFISTMNDDYIHGFKDCYNEMIKIVRKKTNNDDREWLLDSDLRQAYDFCSINEIANKEAEAEILKIAEANLTPFQKTTWLSNVLNRFFIKGYNYAIEKTTE